MKTHYIDNQSPIFENTNLFELDRAIQQILHVSDGNWGADEVKAFSTIIGEKQWINNGHEANKNSPILQSHDTKDHLINEVKFHPSYHQLMDLGIADQLNAQPNSEKWLSKILFDKYDPANFS